MRASRCILASNRQLVLQPRPAALHGARAGCALRVRSSDKARCVVPLHAEEAPIVGQDSTSRPKSGVLQARWNDGYKPKALMLLATLTAGALLTMQLKAEAAELPASPPTIERILSSSSASTGATGGAAVASDLDDDRVSVYAKQQFKEAKEALAKEAKEAKEASDKEVKETKEALAAVEKELEEVKKQGRCFAMVLLFGLCVMWAVTLMPIVLLARNKLRS